MENCEFCCLICRQVFTTENDLKDHTVKDHTNKNQSKFHCSLCIRNFRDSFNLKRHVAFMHSTKNDVKRSKSTKCPICSKGFQKKEMLSHFSSAHDIVLEEQELTFSSLESFEKWKTQIERETKSRYVKVRNVYKYKDGSTLNSFYCHRDGFVKNSRSKNIRRMKTFGSNKINGHCPSKIVVKCNSKEEVQVTYIKTHVGHAAELSRIYLDKKEKEALAEKLAMNIPFDEILDDIRDSIKDSDLQRVHLLSKQDLRNIARDFKVKKDSLPLPENSNVELSLENICFAEPDFLRLYKPKGVVSNEFPQLKAKDFLLMVMNDDQKEMLEKYGNTFLCIDVTHGLFLHDLDMYSIYVLDESHQAFPCAFWFSNRSDTVTIELFFLSIRDILNKVLKPLLLMTNDTLYEAWGRTMVPPVSHIYCSWHVDLDWRNNLKKILDKEKQTVIYKQLRNLLEESITDKFNRKLEQLFCDLYYDSDTNDFAHYLEKYKTSAEKWAYCHRLNVENSFSALEKMHKSLKYIYLKRNKIHGIDDTVRSLMSFLRERFLEQSITDTVTKLIEIKDRHRTAINMTQANLTKISKTAWDVSGSNNDEIFHVEQVKFSCENCLLKCSFCLVCIHLYTCSCYDSNVKWNMCQHIHLVSIVANHEQRSCLSFESFEKPLKISEDEHSSGYDSAGIASRHNDSDNDNLAVIQHISAPLSSSSAQVELKKKEILNKFTYLLDNATSLEQLDLINKQLTPCEQVIGIVYGTKFEANC